MQTGSLADLDILITGANGMLGRAFASVLAAEHAPRSVLSASHAGLDVTDGAACDALAGRPLGLILHCAAWVDADGCERDEERCKRTQVDGTANVVRLAQRTGARLVYPQSFLIFDSSDALVTEATPPSPTSAYGRAKLAAERLVARELPGSLVVRMAGFFGGGAVDKNFVGAFARGLRDRVRRGERTIEVGQRVWQPTYTVDLARNTLALVCAQKEGVYHMASQGSASFFDVACVIQDELGLADTFTLAPVDAKQVARRDVAPRPERVVMSNVRLGAEQLDLMRPWADALREYLRLPYFRHIAAEVRAAGGHLAPRSV
ncbi:MAG TPA: sugar nucleotide-binding protein [Polyangiaceae bacterium]